eukprot:1570925-Rhodomonas_salina.1
MDEGSILNVRRRVQSSFQKGFRIYDELRALDKRFSTSAGEGNYVIQLEELFERVLKLEEKFNKE